MKSAAAFGLCVTAVMLAAAIEGGAQQRPADANDPRVGLKPGLRDAGEAARNMKRISSLPKPEGFFDPANPAGTPIPAERDPKLPPEPPPDPNSPAALAMSNMLGFANSDLAFSGNHVFMGSFHGFNTYDVERPTKPKLAASAVCPGGQGDVSIHGNLLFMSVEQTRGRLDCGTQGIQTPVSAERFRGVRIFDISDLNKPKQVAAIQTCRGSHTHTLVTDPHDKANLYVYGSGTSGVRSGEELAGCSGLKPEEDPNTALFSIDVIQVPIAAPQNAKIIGRPRIFADTATGAIAGLNKGGDSGPGTQKMSETNQCHDITVFPEVGLAAGACSGNGILLDISDPKNPKRLDVASDKNFAYWHSATFNNDGTKVIFTDEWGGGTRPRCRANDPLNWGADAIFDIVEVNGAKKLKFGGYFKMPAAQSEVENCVAHNGSLIPIPGRDVMVQAWYQGGVSVFDWTDIAHPKEIAFYDRGPIDATRLVGGGSWSAYWYNGVIVSSEIARGLDIYELVANGLVSQNEIDAARTVHFDYLNVQGQQKFVWPPSFALARAYVDQLERSQGLKPGVIAVTRTQLDGAEKLTGAGRKASLEKLATQLDGEAATNSTDKAKATMLAKAVRDLAAATR
ncbi:MAG TPA: hypothetical protein VJN96_05845 [Vicinamibacterales bacterium]|nr:hypothetical protein [Vicinamibacterales bacterium]